MLISVVFGTRAKDFDLILGLLQNLDNQTLQDFDVNIVCDKNFDESEESKFLSFFKHQKLSVLQRTKFFTNNNSDFDPRHCGGASYVRNFGIIQAKGKFIQLLDDDDRLSIDFLEKCLKKRNLYTETKKSECVILPSLYYKHTQQIQNQGFSHFSYRMSRPVIHFLGQKSEEQVQMFSGNGLFSLSSTLRMAQYDENIAWICEDMDYTISLYEMGVQLRVFSDLIVNHLEREKTKLEQAWIGSYSQAKQKSRNWFLFVHKHGSNNQIIEFYLCGLPGCLLRLTIKAIIYGGKDRWNICKGLFVGVIEGWKFTHKN